MKFWSLLAAMLLASCAPKAVETAEIDPEFLQNFSRAPAIMANAKNPISEEKVALGRTLYYDPRLSANNDVSCNSCHPLDRYGVDGQPVSTGHNQKKGTRNAPSVYYAAGHRLQFWDGRAADVEEQAKGPVLNPAEMAMPDAAAVEAKLRKIPGYAPLFKSAFPKDAQPVTLDNAASAIAAFERKLVTPSRWDRYLAGDKKALSSEEKAGFLAFYKAGCQACHNGALVGGSLLQKLGLVKPWPNQSDPGRAAVTGHDLQRNVFKVSSLRNVEKTGPYFHDGSVATLEEAIRLMGEYQVEKPLTDREVKAILAWLSSLTGELPTSYIKPI